MADNIGLFGVSPEQLSQAREASDYERNLAAVQLTPMQQSNLMLRQAGSQAGALGSSLLGIQDPQMQAAKEAQTLASQFDLTSSAGLKDLTLALQERAQQTGNQALASLIPQAAAAYQKAALNEATVAAKMREKTPNIGEQVNQGLYTQALKDAKGDPVLAAKLYNDREQAEKKGVAQAGVTPAPGQVSLADLGKAQELADKFTAKPKAKLDQIGVLGALGAGVINNPTLLPKFKQEMTRFAGDNQVSAKEVEKSLGSLGFASDVIEGVNSFLEGKPTDVKINKVLEGMKGLEKVYAKQYNTGVDKVATVLEQGKLAPETRKVMTPDKYVTTPKVVAPSVGVVQNGYQFLGGNPADPKSWKAVK